MRLLVIGPLNNPLQNACIMAKEAGASVTHVSTIPHALNHLCDGKGADLLFVDINCDIKILIQQLFQARITLPVIACGIEANSDLAVAAIENGAKEFLPLPPDKELIAAILQSFTSKPDIITGKSPATTSLLTMVDQVAPSTATILITGESGSGKEVFSRLIFEKSKRKDKPYIAVNCAAIPEHLLESELFGHEKGAFTGATSKRIGKFEEAHRGTILLDEISEIDIKLQAKLLRAIQEQEITRLGGNQPVPLDIRIIATSNRNLTEAVKQGTFREDLYYRLNVIHLSLPPLRARKEDIPQLAQYFIEMYSQANDLPIKPLSEEAVHRLSNHSWPGNVRELENTMHRAVLLSSGETIEDDAILLSPSTSENAQNQLPQNGSLVGRTVESVERDLILNTLEECVGNRTHAAKILGISIRTLRNKLNQYSQENKEVA